MLNVWKNWIGVGAIFPCSVFYLSLSWLIAALQMATIKKNCSTSISKKKGWTQVFPIVSGRKSQTRTLSIRDVTFQEECPFTIHVWNKLIEVNKCLFILRSLIRRVEYTQAGRIRPSVSKSLSPIWPMVFRSIQCCTELSVSYTGVTGGDTYLRRSTSMIY